MQEKLVAILKNGTNNLFKTGAIYNIYPKYIPDGKLPTNALIYNLTNQTIQYKQTSSNVQLTVVSQLYDENVARVRALVELFSEKRYETAGDFISTQVQSVIELGYDNENKYYLTAVNLFIKDII